MRPCVRVSCSPLPLDVLSAMVDEWVADRKSRVTVAWGVGDWSGTGRERERGGLVGDVFCVTSKLMNV